MAKLGFIGLGVMGGNMVARLLEKGHSVTGYNRTRSKAQWLIDRGMQFADSPRAVAEASDVTFTMVTNAAALGAVTDGPNGLLRGVSTGKFHIDMSTVSPEISRELAAKIREKGADMIDAPVSSSNRRIKPRFHRLSLSTARKVRFTTSRWAPTSLLIMASR